PTPPDRPLRIGISTRSPLKGIRVDPELAGAVVEAGRRLAGAGHTLEWADAPRARTRDALALIETWCAAVAQDAEGLDFQKLEARTRGHVRLGRIARSLGLVRSKDREAWRKLHDVFFRRFDLLLTPILASAPIRADAWSRRGWMANFYANVCFAPFTAAWNFAGYPAAAVPAGVRSDGMPLSVQLVAPNGSETLILSVAKQLEVLQPWARHAPTRL
ncbi:MAG: amidase family protein, partial [Steroidobacteraceae bacterium]